MLSFLKKIERCVDWWRIKSRLIIPIFLGVTLYNSYVQTRTDQSFTDLFSKALNYPTNFFVSILACV